MNSTDGDLPFEGKNKCLVVTVNTTSKDKIGWLRAVVLGSNDGIISVSSIMLGVATAHALRSNILLPGSLA
jgi:VIT1/CCC1 family predicted Fe2+/Mn2+ transporter